MEGGAVAAARALCFVLARHYWWLDASRLVCLFAHTCWHAHRLQFTCVRSRLLTCEADKSIKIWREDTDASPESHPVDMKGWADFCRTHKYY